MCYSEPVVVNHMCYAEPVAVDHSVLCWESIYESWWVMISQWLCFMVCYAEAVAMNHGVLYRASGCESYCVILLQWLWIILCYAAPVVINHLKYWRYGKPREFRVKFNFAPKNSRTMIHNHYLSIAHHVSQPLAQRNTHNSQPLAQYNTTWFTSTVSE